MRTAVRNLEPSAEGNILLAKCPRDGPESSAFVQFFAGSGTPHRRSRIMSSTKLFLSPKLHAIWSYGVAALSVIASSDYFIVAGYAFTIPLPRPYFFAPSCSARGSVEPDRGCWRRPSPLSLFIIISCHQSIRLLESQKRYHDLSSFWWLRCLCGR